MGELKLSQPLPPDELLKEIKELPEFIEYRDAIRTQHNHPFSIEYMRTFEAEDKLISAILLKCHQSEAAEIASLQADIEELNILFRGNSEVYEARIKELEDKLKLTDYDRRITLHETWYWMGDGEDHLESLECPVIINADDLRDLIAEARADQNKKIGNYFNKHFPTRDQMFEAIAKLQKGEF